MECVASGAQPSRDHGRIDAQRGKAQQTHTSANVRQWGTRLAADRHLAHWVSHPSRSTEEARWTFRSLLRFGVFLSFLLVLPFNGDGRLLNVDSRVVAASSDCEEVCNGGRDCSDPCWIYPPGLPGAELT
jgi:hypothetical protein